MNLPDYINVSCSFCGSNEYRVYTFDKDHFDLQPRKVKCKKCGLVYANPQATFEKLEDYYSNVYAHSDNTDIKVVEEERKKLVESNKGFFR